MHDDRWKAPAPSIVLVVVKPRSVIRTLREPDEVSGAPGSPDGGKIGADTDNETGIGQSESPCRLVVSNARMWAQVVVATSSPPCSGEVQIARRAGPEQQCACAPRLFEDVGEHDFDDQIIAHPDGPFVMNFVVRVASAGRDVRNVGEIALDVEITASASAPR